MRSEQMRASYARVEHNGTVTSADYLLLVKDFDNRIAELENTIEELAKSSSDGRKTSKVSKRKIPST